MYMYTYSCITAMEHIYIYIYIYRWPVFISKFQRSVWIIFQDKFWFVHIPFVHMVKLNSLHDSQLISLPTQLCQVLYSFCASLLHSLIMWLIVSPHNIHLLFSCVLPILALIWMVHMAVFWDAIRRYSVSLLWFPFHCHIQVFSYKMSLFCRLKYLYRYFSSRFCFRVILVLLILVLYVLFLVTVISLFCAFLCRHWVVVLMYQCCRQCRQVNSLPLFSSLIMSKSSLGCKDLCMVISFLVLWSICLRSSLIHIKNGPEYRSSRTAKVFILS